MALRTSFRYRRLKKAKAKITHKIITFKLINHWVALPIEATIKVFKAEEIKQNNEEERLNVIHYKGQEISVVHLVASGINKNIETRRPPLYFVLIQDQEDNILAIPFYSHPKLLLYDESNIKLIPETNLELKKVRLVCLNIIEIPDYPQLFLLEPELLLNKLLRSC